MAYDIGPRISVAGEAEFNQAIRQINTTMRQLSSEMELAASQFDGNQNSMEALRAKSDVLNKQLEAQESAQKRLTEQHAKQTSELSRLAAELEKAKSAYGDNSAEAAAAEKVYERQVGTVSRLQTEMNKTQTRINSLNSEIQKNAKYQGEAEKSTDGLAKSIDEYGKEVGKASEKTSVFGDILKASLASEAIIAGVKALGGALKSVNEYAVSAGQYADNFLTMSEITGISVQNLQEFNYMQELLDVSLETITSSLTRQVNAMRQAAQGTTATQDAYAKLGVAYQNVDGSLRDNLSVYWDVVDALGEMTNETERDAIAMQLMGRSARDLLPLINAGSDGIAEFAAEARAAGAVLSDETMAQLGETDDAMQRLYQSVDIAKRKFGVELAPALEQAATKITRRIRDMDDGFAHFAGGALNAVTDGLFWVMDNAEGIAVGLGSIAAAVISFKAAQGVTVAVQALQTMKAATDAATVSTTALTAAQMATPWGLIAAGIGGVVAALAIYNAVTPKAKTETELMIESLRAEADAASDLTRAAEKLQVTRTTGIEDIELTADTTRRLIDELYTLAAATEQTNETKETMSALLAEINRAMPDLNLSLNAETGELSAQRNEVEQLVGAHERLAKAKATQDYLTEITKKQIELETQLSVVLEKRAQAETERQKAARSGKITSETTQAAKVVKELTKAEQGLKSALSDLAKEWDIVTGVIADTSELTAAEKAYNAYKETLLAGQRELLAASESEYAEALEKNRERLADELDDFLYFERQKFRDAQKAKLRDVEDAVRDELAVMETAHNDKIALINSEYSERLKLIDEEKYNRLQAIQSEIDGIENAAKTEQEAERKKEQAAKLAELTEKAESGRTYAVREQAQRDLLKLQAEIESERIEQERKAEIARLKELQNALKKEYDEKAEAVKTEQKAAADAVTAEYNAQKAAYNAQFELLKTELSRKQELETREEERRIRALKKLRETAATETINAIKSENAAQLAELKRNNDEIINEELRKQQAILAATPSAGSGVNPLLTTPNWSSMPPITTTPTVSVTAPPVNITPAPVVLDGRTLAQILFPFLEDERARLGR